jgi:hypothetical protein
MSLYRVRKKAGINGHATQHARQISLLQGQQTKVIDYITDPQTNWSLYLFANDNNGKDITIIQSQQGAGFGTTGEIKYSLGGYENGQLISGTGSVTINAIANQSDNVLSIYFVEEVHAQILPPLSTTVVVANAGDLLDNGYPPFGRNFCNIYSNAGFTMKFLSNTGVDLFGYLLNQGTDKLFLQGFFHPPVTRLNILSSIDSQTFVISHYQYK